MQLIHGDARLGNICWSLEGETVYLDFGFLAWRPRIHELAYALAFMLLALGGHRAPESLAWEAFHGSLVNMSPLRTPVLLWRRKEP